MLGESASDLGKAWVDEAFVMKKELAGVKELPPRWRRCVRRVDADLGELLAQPYVKARFGGDSKARAAELAKDVLAAMAVELDKLPWMDPPTRIAAKGKLDKMIYLVGYPDKWRNYDFEVTKADSKPWAGSVAKVGKGGKIYITAGSDINLPVGATLSVRRLGEEITDPTTGAVIGHELGKTLGHLQLAEHLNEKLSVCVATQGATFAAGDMVTLDASKAADTE